MQRTVGERLLTIGTTYNAATKYSETFVMTRTRCKLLNNDRIALEWRLAELTAETATPENREISKRISEALTRIDFILEVQARNSIESNVDDCRFENEVGAKSAANK